MTTPANEPPTKMRALAKEMRMWRDVNRAVKVGRVCRIAVIAGALFMALGLSGQDAAWAQTDLDARVGKELDSLLVIYKQLHANPELSTQEE
jgi:hypothetical protein